MDSGRPRRRDRFAALRHVFLLVVAAVLLLCPAGAFAQPAVLLAAGDIASCAVDGDELTARILDRQAGTVAVLGDASQTDGSAASFAHCYAPTWGRHKRRTRPAPGNHDYGQPGPAPYSASAYFAYFGARAGPPGRGYYSYDRGAWHIVSLNSNCMVVSCAAGSAQVRWLRNDLAAHPADCTLAYWHHPRFSSGRRAQLERVEPFWAALYEAGADIVLSGHDHIYERFAPQTPIGDLNPAYGIREFVVGTGGFGHKRINAVRPLSRVRNSKTFGVLKLTLRSGSYGWRFLPVPGSTFTDTGSGVCHATQADTTPPSARITLPAHGAVVAGAQTLAADASGEPARVDFLIGQAAVATDRTEPFAVEWDTTRMADGLRMLRTRAVDAAGNATTTAPRPIVIDNHLPDTTIRRGPPAITRTNTQVLYFVSEPGATFKCSLNRSRPRPCTSPKSYSNLAPGRKVFLVRARDAAGRVERFPAQRIWRIVR